MCAIFAKRLDGRIIVARNFDWMQKGGMVHFNAPRNRYGQRTLGLCLFEQFGDERPFDGMNSEGLFVGMNNIHVVFANSNDHASKGIVLDEFGAIRFILERAKTASEAAEIFNRIHITSHNLTDFVRVMYLVIDAKGQWFAYQPGKEIVIRSAFDPPYPMMTIFPPSMDIEQCERFNCIKAKISHVNSTQDAVQLLQEVASQTTIYSLIYDLLAKEVHVYIEGDFESAEKLFLNDEIGSGSTYYSFGELKLKAKSQPEPQDDSAYIQNEFSHR